MVVVVAVVRSDKTDFLALDLAPLDHSASSVAAFWEDSAAAFALAASAFWNSVQCWRKYIRGG